MLKLAEGAGGRLGRQDLIDLGRTQAKFRLAWSGRRTRIRSRLWGDLSEADLAAAGRVLSTALRRANAELGYSI
jgi:hypothetical protein